MKNPIGTIVRSGQRCPENGVWALQDQPSTQLSLSQANIFPPHDGKTANWKLVSYS